VLENIFSKNKVTLMKFIGKYIQPMSQQFILIVGLRMFPIKEMKKRIKFL
jgi:hypothetical protein